RHHGGVGLIHITALLTTRTRRIRTEALTTTGTMGARPATTVLTPPATIPLRITPAITLPRIPTAHQPIRTTMPHRPITGALLRQASTIAARRRGVFITAPTRLAIFITRDGTGA